MRRRDVAGLEDDERLMAAMLHRPALARVLIAEAGLRRTHFREGLRVAFSYAAEGRPLEGGYPSGGYRTALELAGARVRLREPDALALAALVVARRRARARGVQDGGAEAACADPGPTAAPGGAPGGFTQTDPNPPGDHARSADGRPVVDDRSAGGWLVDEPSSPALEREPRLF